MYNKIYFKGIWFIIGIVGCVNSMASQEVDIRVPLVYHIKHKQEKSINGAFIKEDGVYVNITELLPYIGLYLVKIQDTFYISDDEKLIIEEASFEEATILSIDEEQKEVTILPRNDDDMLNDSVTILTTKETDIIYPILDRVYPFSILKKGMKVTVKGIEPIKDNSAAYYAKCIEIIEEASDSKHILPAIESVYVVEINKEEQYIVVDEKPETDITKTNQVIIHIDYNTNIKDKQGKNHYKIEELELGERVTVVTNGIKTNSTPPQTLGLEIILLDKN